MAKAKNAKRAEGRWTWVADGIDRVTLNLRAGVIGRLTLLGIACLAFFAVVYWLSPETARTHNLTVFIISVGTLIVLALIGGTFWYANKHPETALMEGAQILSKKRLEITTKAGITSTELLAPSSDPLMPLIAAGEQAALPDAMSSTTAEAPRG